MTEKELQKGVCAGRVSVIIPVFNRPDYLRDAVASVMAQSYADWEIILVDDGSDDGATVELCAALAAEDPVRIRVVRQANAGAGPARERGRREARGEFIQYLDSDDRLLPNAFADHVAALRAQPDADIAYGVTRLIDAEGRVLCDPFKWTGRRIDRLFPKLLVDRWWCTSSPLYRRTLTDRLGAWINLPQSEDWEYDGRAGALGARLVPTGTTVSEMRTHGGPRLTGGRTWLTPRDRVRFLRRLYRYARRAGVTGAMPEMRHFARWTFLEARRCGAAGAARSAWSLWRLSVLASGRNPDRGMRVVAGAARLLGWRVTGTICAAVDRVRKHGTSGATLDLAWTERTRPGAGGSKEWAGSHGA